MELLSPVALKQNLGKESFWNPRRLLNKLSYVSGIEAFDALFQGKCFLQVAHSINVKIRRNGIELELVKGFKRHSVGLTKLALNQIYLEDKDHILRQKQNSQLGRALQQRLLHPPAGPLLEDFAFGHKIINEKVPDLYLTFHFTDGLQAEKVVVLSGMYKDEKQISAFLQSALPTYFYSR